MAKGRRPRKFEDLTVAVLRGTADDVRRMIADGATPDDREEIDEPTPLMVAAARGQLDIVEALVKSGADVNALAEDLSGELDQFPFLDEFVTNARLTGLTALAYAALYGQEQVYEYLTSRTAANLRQGAKALREAKAAHPDFVPRPYLESKPPSARQTEREQLLLASAAARRWVVQCPLCGKQGYKPAMPDEIDRRGTAVQIHKFFRPMALVEYLCEQCGSRVAKARQKIDTRQRSLQAIKARQEAEARWEKRKAKNRRGKGPAAAS